MPAFRKNNDNDVIVKFDNNYKKPAGKLKKVFKLRNLKNKKLFKS